ncbi:Eco57I restriction-modification methylase domain-containing protein [Kytococcus sedentarius]|uniref:Eco57I restriction-modification methylase domain-containing protein n=1 Tax=Kytococcus sedentarius TaxID=1276 RepID=UPI0019506492|nr:DNA methyltransferase [Kytococcus sedentarius]QRO87012.1 SAM-dependent DNA methyltransferase [Kytococcus sedentarius]
MTTRRTRGMGNVADRHRAWLQLVDTEGPFVAVPALRRVYPDGIEALSGDSAAYARLRDAKPAMDRAWDAWAADPTGTQTLEAYRQTSRDWVETVLRDVAGWHEDLTAFDAAALPGAVARSGDHRHSTQPTHVVRGTDGAPVLLVQVIDPVADGQPLRMAPKDGWAASPVDRMELMLRGAGVPVGVVTDGRWWALVSAPLQGGLPSSGVVDSQTWIEEPAVRDGFFALISPMRLVGAAEENLLPQMFRESEAAAEEITEALGTQVRRAVELLVQAMSEAGAAAHEAGEPDPLPEDDGKVYEAAVTAMMRVVFLLFAEERDMVPEGPLFSLGYGLSDQVDVLERRAELEGEEALDATSRTWHRLLGTSRAFYDGASCEDMRLPAYGGSLFDPHRFAWLEATTDHGDLRVRITDRVMLHALRAVQYAHLGTANMRRISFREVDVEQIGYIYEGLLGYTSERTDQIVVGLGGKTGAEPEIPLRTLEALAAQHEEPKALAQAILVWAKKEQPSATGSTVAKLTKGLQAEVERSDAERLLLPVTGDERTRQRLRPWLGVIRTDLRGRPTVSLPGGLLVTETPSRKNAGAHYTPRALAEEVVLHTLEPLVYQPGPRETENRDEWKLLRSSDLLSLKVADLAVGSGAFLVAAARYLADRVVEAWEAEGTVEAGTSPEDLLMQARREVVARCLYGVDINPMAIEMCKLSLWLVSLDREKPFSFVDDKVFHGNSLLGVTRLDQVVQQDIHATHAQGQSALAIGADGSAALMDLEDKIRSAAEKRRQLATPVEEGAMRNRRSKELQLAEIEEITEQARAVADAVVAMGLNHGGKRGKALETAYMGLRNVVATAFPPAGGGDRTALDDLVVQGLTPQVPTDYEQWPTLHWPIAVPDVVHDGRGSGFDAIIGNPPFLGGKKLSPAMGSNVREWFVNAVAGGRSGNADLVAYFFLRAQSLLNDRGTLGLIATNTVAQGDTREVGLDQMVKSGFTITRAVQSEAWPASGVNLEYAAVWGTVGAVHDSVWPVVEGARVPKVSTLLEASGRVGGHPQRLAENAGIAFIGCYVLGKGFVLEPSEAAQWIEEDPKNAEVLFPYLNGEDLNSRPDGSPSRWVIDFGERPAADAERYGAPWGRVSEGVYPERVDKDAEKYPRMVNEWWKFWNPRPALRRAIQHLSEMVVVTRVSNTVMPLRIPAGPVCSDAVVVFASEDYGFQTVVSSSIHQVWAVARASSLGAGVRYTPTDVFETFPRPYDVLGLRDIGRRLDEQRREIMLRRDLGLTKLYNLVNDPGVSDADSDVALLRELHADLDRQVMAAYGWDDVELNHGFHTYRKMTRWTVDDAARVEILDRLLEENHRRAQLELENGGRAVRPASTESPEEREDA